MFQKFKENVSTLASSTKLTIDDSRKKLDDFVVMCPIVNCATMMKAPPVPKKDKNLIFACVNCKTILQNPTEQNRAVFIAKQKTYETSKFLQNGLNKAIKETKNLARRESQIALDPVQLQVTVPQNLGANRVVAVLYGDQTYYVTVPEGLKPGETFSAMINPQKSERPSDSAKEVYVAEIAYQVAAAKPAEPAADAAQEEAQNIYAKQP